MPFKKIEDFENKYSYFLLDKENMKYWASIRYNIFMEVFKNEKKVYKNKSRISKRNIINSYLWSKTRRTNLVKNSKVLYFTTPDLKRENGNIYKDIIYDYLFDIYRGNIIEDISTNHKKNYINIDNTEYFENIILAPFLFSNIRFSLRSKIKKYLIKLSFYLSEFFKEKIIINKKKYITKLSFYNELEKKYEYYFNKYKPKLIILNAGHYGNHFSGFIKKAKDKNIITAEFQHGVISKMHPAYNYGEAILNSEEYKQYTPDYFLTYGEYWNNQIKIPGKKYVVGNPHFHESIKRYKDIEEEKNTILIVSQWTLTKEFVEIAEYLANNLKDKKIIFKMHPGEMQNYELIKPLESFQNIEVKKGGDIYELLAKSESIIACYSTTVFEAMAFKKNIYILDNEFSNNHIPKEIGLRFKNNHELLNLIKNKVKNDWDLDIEYYFNSNWKENYKKFIEKMVK